MGKKQAKGYSLSPREIEIVKHVNDERHLENESLALRLIIHEWNELKNGQSTLEPAKAA